MGAASHKPWGAENGVFCDNYVNTMAGDVLAPFVARSSVTMGLAVQDKGNIVFHGEGFQLHASSHFLTK